MIYMDSALASPKGATGSLELDRGADELNLLCQKLRDGGNTCGWWIHWTTRALTSGDKREPLESPEVVRGE